METIDTFKGRTFKGVTVRFDGSDFTFKHDKKVPQITIPSRHSGGSTWVMFGYEPDSRKYSPMELTDPPIEIERGRFSLPVDGKHPNLAFALRGYRDTRKGATLHNPAQKHLNLILISLSLKLELCSFFSSSSL